jgi:hypothetical protein
MSTKIFFITLNCFNIDIFRSPIRKSYKLNALTFGQIPIKGDYVRMSKPKEFSSMTKDKLMTYTFIALLAITIVSAALWSQVTPLHLDGKTSMNLGLTVVICALISVGVAVGIDALFYKLVSDSPLNLMSAAVFGLIVTLLHTRYTQLEH